MFEQYKIAVENNNITSKTDISGVITFVNDEFCKISGYTKEELLGQNHNIVRHPDVPKQKFIDLWETILAKRTYKSTVKNRSKDGNTFYVNTTVIPILDDNGEIIEFLAIRYDVTAEIELRMALELEVAKNHEKQKIMFWQSRHAALGQMLASIAHQWRQPLTELNLVLYNLFKSVKENNIENQYLFYGDSKKIIQNMSKTIEDFRNFFKPDKEKKRFFIHIAILEALSILKRQLISSHITVKTDFEHLEVVGVLNELTQVIINLIQNAKEAFEQNKTQGKREIYIKVYSDKNDIYINVQDNAGGVKNELQEQIFEPYFTTKSTNGTGLGLFMSRLVIAQSFGGNIFVQNGLDGALFIIKLGNKNE